MVGVKRRVDAADEPTGKRSKVKQASAPAKKSGKPASSAPKKDTKQTKGNTQQGKKQPQQEESEEDDEFDIDDVSSLEAGSADDQDEDIDMDSVSAGEEKESEDEDEDDESEDEEGKPEKKRKTGEKSGKKSEDAKSMIYLLSWVELQLIASYRQFVSRIPRKAKSRPTRTQSRETERRYYYSLQETVGALAPKVARAAGGKETAHFRALHHHYWESERFRFQT